MRIVKEITALVIAVFIAFALSAFTESPNADFSTVTFASYDLAYLRPYFEAFRKDPHFLDEITYKEDCAEVMSGISDKNYILMPSVIDLNKIEYKDGSFYICVNDDFRMSGVLDDCVFIYRQNFRQEEIDWRIKLNEKRYNDVQTVTREIDGITVTAYVFPSSYYDEKTAREGDFCFFDFQTADGLYQLEVYGSENLETLLDDMSFYIFPMRNGFVHSNGKTLYSYGGEFLKGWYKIGGKRYYFDEDGVIATGTVSINGREYSFGDDGVYIE